MAQPRQDFLLQPYTYNGIEVWDFPLDDFYLNGVIQPTPYGNSDEQHKIDIIVNNIGAIKQFPLLGFGLFKRLNSEFDTNEVNTSLSQNMKSDGYLVKSGAVTKDSNGKLNINLKLIVPNY